MSIHLEVDEFGPILVQPISRMRRFSGQRMHAAWTQIPHVTHHEDVDVTEIEAARQRWNKHRTTAKLQLLAYVIRACVMAIRKFPSFCASLSPSGDMLCLKQYVNIGIAVETQIGLVVPVIPAADIRSLGDLGDVVHDLATRARSGSLKPSEMEGSCFTISSIGGMGGTGFTPIINCPNVAILGIAQARVRPEYIDGVLVPRLILPLSLSYDHRVIDGAEAARFCMFLRENLGNPVNLVR